MRTDLEEEETSHKNIRTNVFHAGGITGVVLRITLAFDVF